MEWVSYHVPIEGREETQALRASSFSFSPPGEKKRGATFELVHVTPATAPAPLVPYGGEGGAVPPIIIILFFLLTAIAEARRPATDTALLWLAASWNHHSVNGDRNCGVREPPRPKSWD